MFEKLKKILKSFLCPCDYFEPAYIRCIRRGYTFFSYLVFLSYFGYIIYSVATAPTVLSLDEDLSHPNDAQIPNIYFSYSSHNLSHDPQLTIDCIYNDALGLNATWVPGCQPWLQVDPDEHYGFIFKTDYDTLRFGNGTDPVVYIQNIVFLINFTASPINDTLYFGHYRGDYIFIEFADPDYDITCENVTSNIDIENQYYIANDNSVTLSPNEYVYVAFSRTILTALNTVNDWLNRIGIYKPNQNNTKTTLDIVWEHHHKPKIRPTSVLNLFPSTYIVMKQKETYTLTFISAIGSHSALIGTFGFIGFFLFGSKRLKAFGYLHWHYYDEYKQLLYRGDSDIDMPFEVAIQSLNQDDSNSMTYINRESSSSDSFSIASPFRISGPKLQIRVLSSWFD